jgi:protoporphyrinogen oxidase
MTETLELAPPRTAGPQTVIVIGAGITGLTAAYRLLQRGFRVRVYEASDRVGGLVRTFEAGAEPLECFYHHLFTSDGAAIRLIDEIGLGDRLTWRRSKMGVFHGGRLYPFTNAFDLIRFSPLGLRDKIRLGSAALRLRREEDGSALEKITAADWVERHMGTRALNAIWRPLLRGKFGERADEVVMTWLWNRIRTRFSSRNGEGPLSGELLGYATGSFGAVAETLAERVRGLGGKIETGRAVTRIVRKNIRVGVEVNAKVQFAHAVVATVANEAFLRIAPQMESAYVEKLTGIHYQDALCLVLSLSRPLTEFYWVNICDESMPFVAAIEHTNLVEPERYGGQHIVYLSSYLEKGATHFDATADELFKLYAPHLKKLNPEFDESWLNGCWVFQGKDAQPVFTVGAGARIAAHRTPVEGLYLANMGQIYPHDRGQNHSIELGERVAEAVEVDMAMAVVRKRTA